MYDAVLPPIQLMAGNLILYGMLTMVVAGSFIPAVTLIIGVLFREGALSNPAAPESMAATADYLQSFLPWTIGLAVLVFVIRLLPGIVKAYRRA